MDKENHTPIWELFGGYSSARCSPPDAMAQPPPRDNKPYKCPHCVKAFANNSYLTQHMRIHLGIKPFGPCEYCSKKFTQLSHLQQHRRTHTGEKPYKCKVLGCEKSFSQLSNLQSHSRSHQQDKPYKCNSCYKCFNDEPSLLEHIPKHKESKHLKIHICTYCGKSYTQALYLEKHMAKHADKPRFPVTNYNKYSEFSDLNELNSLGNFGQIGGNSLRSFQQLAAAAQQQQQQQPTAPQQIPNGANQVSSLTVPNNNVAAALNNGNAVVSSVAQAYGGYPNITNAQANQMIGNPALSLEFFNRNLQRENMNLRNSAQDRTGGFNMITPLENIKTFSQGADFKNGFAHDFSKFSNA